MKRVEMKAFVIFLLIAPVSMPGQVDVTGTATLSGTVNDEAGRPVDGALVSIFLEMPDIVRGKRPDSFAPFSSFSVTSRAGSFSAGNIPKGNLKVCAKVEGSDYLDECRWQQGTGPVNVSSGQRMQLPAITLRKGFRLKIRVDDARGEAAALARAGKPEGLIIGVFTDNGLFAPARQLSTDAAGFDLEVLVPFDTSLHLSMYSKGLALADAAGKAGDAARGIVVPLTIPTGGSMAPIRVAVTGTVASVAGPK